MSHVMSPNMFTLPKLTGIAFAAMFAASPAMSAEQQNRASFTVATMVLQDFSDCQNSTVKDDGGTVPGGAVFLSRQPDGSIAVKVGITATPNTKYNFYLKCVRQLGVVNTHDEGVGEAVFSIPPGVSGLVTFDMYPDGAPAGNKFQSVAVNFK